MSVEAGLTLTASFAQGVVLNASISRTQNAVFACDVILPVTPVDAMLYEQGGSGIGCWVGVRGGGATLRIRAGDGAAAKTGSTTDTAVLDVPVGSLPFDGNVHTIVWEFKISPGKVRLWVDGVSYGTSSTTLGGNLEGNAWSGGDPGSYATPTSSLIVVGENNAAWSGSVSSLRYYQNQTIACGPWVLEDLDQFGNIDSLAFSLDSAIWASADTCILDFSGAITGQGSVIAAGKRTRTAEGVISGFGSLDGNGLRERLFSGSIQAAGFLSSGTTRTRTADGSIFGIGSLSAFGGLQVDAIAFILGNGEIVVNGQLIANKSATFFGISSVNATGYIYGQEWSAVADEANTWTTVSPESNVWTTRTSGTNTWLQRG